MKGSNRGGSANSKPSLWSFSKKSCAVCKKEKKGRDKTFSALKGRRIKKGKKR